MLQIQNFHTENLGE